MSVPIHRPMRERDPHEAHRTATPLELFFDLAVVVAVSATAAALHHGVSEGHVGKALVGYLSVFFGVWWAWVNYTWFSSAYDTDDMVMRFMTMLQMAGVVVLAAGVPRASDGDFRITTLGYFIMRIALVFQWIRARHESGDRYGICRRYAIGILAVQVLWILRLVLPSAGIVQWPIFGVLVLGELAVPAIAERGTPGSSWHPDHITERYGAFVIIVCGEVILSTSDTFATAVEDGLTSQLLMVGIGALLIVFAIWWTYFQRNVAEEIEEHGPWTWAYLHFVVFAAIAAVGSGIGVMVDLAIESAEVSQRVGDLALALAIVAYLLALGIAHRALTGLHHEFVIICAIAALVLVAGLLGLSSGRTCLLLGLVLVGAVIANTIAVARSQGSSAPDDVVEPRRVSRN